MKTALTLAIGLAVMPLAGHAQEKPADRLMELFELFSQDAQTLMQEMIEELGPALEELKDQVEDFQLYEAPEVLPNGDIIIRRKPPKPESQETPSEDGEIEL